MDSAEFHIKTEAFEGPLDILLQLIEKRKLHISDISLASVTDDFISYVKKLEHFPIPQIAHFVLIASTLLLIKSKSLLPVFSLTQEEEGNIEDLEYRLKLYKRFKELSLNIKEHFGVRVLYPKMHGKIVDSIFSPPPQLSNKKINESILEVMRNLPKKVFVKEITIGKVISLEEMITNLTERIQQSLKLSFQEFSQEGGKDKIHVIVGFLAMLELVKQEFILVTQEESFGDIQIENKHIGVPKYS